MEDSDPTGAGQRADMTRTVELVRRAQAGDRDAMDRLCARYYERVRAVVRVRLGARLRSKLESGDIVQEVFRHAVERFDQFEMRNAASLIQWLAQQAEWQILDLIDRNKAGCRDWEHEVSADANEHREQVASVVDSSATPLADLCAQEGRDAVEESIDELSPAHREVIVLRNYIGYRWREIAEQTGRSVAAARDMYGRTLVELGRKLRARRAGEP